MPDLMNYDAAKNLFDALPLALRHSVQTSMAGKRNAYPRESFLSSQFLCRLEIREVNPSVGLVAVAELDHSEPRFLSSQKFEGMTREQSYPG
jgi:hypothetical protein